MQTRPNQQSAPRHDGASTQPSSLAQKNPMKEVATHVTLCAYLAS